MPLEWAPLALDHIDALHALVRRWEAHWGVPLATPPEEISEWLTDPHLDPDLDTRGVWSDTRLVACGFVQHQPSGVRQERAFVTGRVDPDMRGVGIGRRLLAWQIERAVERLRERDPSLPRFVRAYEWEWIEDAHRLYARYGLVPVRWFEDMIRALDEPLTVPIPEGAEIAPWSEAPPEEIRMASNESFADHWGSTPRDATAWEHMLTGTGMRPDLSFLALAGGKVVGICLNASFPGDEAVTGRRDGWIVHLGVLRDWRRRGIAAALIARSLEAFRSADFTHAMLGVDADNPSGASGLYRRLGFDPTHRTVTSELQVNTDGTDPRGAFR